MTMTTDPNTVHVIPVGDLVEHSADDDCPCVPSTVAVHRDDGSYGWVATHHSLDGREFAEPDYTGPLMPVEP